MALYVMELRWTSTRRSLVQVDSSLLNNKVVMITSASHVPGTYILMAFPAAVTVITGSLAPL